MTDLSLQDKIKLCSFFFCSEQSRKKRLETICRLVCLLSVDYCSRYLVKLTVGLLKVHIRVWTFNVALTKPQTSWKYSLSTSTIISSNSFRLLLFACICIQKLFFMFSSCEKVFFFKVPSILQHFLPDVDTFTFSLSLSRSLKIKFFIVQYCKRGIYYFFQT